MVLLYGLLWRFLLFLVHVKRAAVAWMRVRLRSWRVRLWERTIAALFLPVSVSEFPNYQKKTTLNQNANRLSGNRTGTNPSRPLADGKALEKLPVHVGLMVAEEELSYTDIASLVVWCMAIGVSYVSVYDNNGVFQKNSSHLQEEILRQQQKLVGADESKHSVELLNTDQDQHFVVSCRPMLKVLSPEDGKHSIVQAARKLCHSVENKERSSKDISVSMLDDLLRESKNIPDPELVVKFGPVNSTLGFLPWHIRLTEFISLPSHRNVSYEDLLGVLQRYSSCQQRLGQ
ncbi:dehydrodolichyl diphosphate synthase complex subunit nus1 [Nothobranchius furzeri]|uniref:ditrans,polycis-polyprenyl diphosphate synthase [(2E,6E)-farnesyldiphosphate specific] n=1 Tax=Nothobranchius furzeri TaxID=105023 RepID=A0A1A8B623_NOTFU|nr:dehydrodolichyl diphosphate synthase complex subunit nus1 [Nothobranchius furzeri]KAF7208932.1 NUS1 dehydrodolichyl diphosphate synthase subunit [Nothobranchius furzeri]